MDIDSLIITGRVIERLLIILIGGISLGMGWHLYVKGVDKKQVAEIKNQSIVIRFKDVGPGAFFIVFGAIILTVALVKSLNYSIEEKVTNAIKNNKIEPSQANLSPVKVNSNLKENELLESIKESKKNINFSNLINTGPKKSDVITAITTIDKSMSLPIVNFNNKDEEKSLKYAVNILKQYKDILLQTEYEMYPEYKKQKDNILNGIEPDFNKIDKKTYGEISELDQNIF